MKASDLIAVIPELVLLVAACAVLLVEAFAGKDSQGPLGAGRKPWAVGLALLGALGSVVASLILLAGESRITFNSTFVLDEWGVFFNVLFGVAAGLAVLMSPAYLEAHRRHLGEYYALLLFTLMGMDLLAGARDFIVFYVALELMAISSYLLAAFFRYRLRSNESALKYFLTGSFASAVLLYGISLVYGQAGATDYWTVGKVLGSQGASPGVLLAVFLVGVGLAFKVSAAPFHMWTPDVYQGAPTPVTAFFSVGPKAAAFSVLITAFVFAFGGAAKEWSAFFIVLAIATMLVGNAVALVQTNVKRMLAYSSIAHAGYMLAGLAALGWKQDVFPAMGVLVYLAAYTFMNLGAFGILGHLKAQAPATFDYSLGKLAGLGRRSPGTGLLFSLFLISLTGIPGTAGFIGKFWVFSGVVMADLWWLAVIAVLLSAVAAYFYLRVIIYMFFREPEGETVAGRPLSGGMAVALVVCAVATVVIGVLPGRLWDAVTGVFATFLG
jgi:NADH-quinone oxidoreductase subunit N